MFFEKLDLINEIVSDCTAPRELNQKINDFAEHCVNKENDESLNQTRFFVFLTLDKMINLSTLPEVQIILGELIEKLRNTYEGTFGDKIVKTMQEINNAIQEIPLKKRDKLFFRENAQNELKLQNLNRTLKLVQNHFGNIPVKSEELMKSAVVITDMNDSKNIINNNF